MKSQLRFVVTNTYKTELFEPVIVVRDIIWETDVEEFLNHMVENNVTELAFVATWSGCIELLNVMLMNGWRVDSPITVNRLTIWDEMDELKGVKLVRNASTNSNK